MGLLLLVLTLMLPTAGCAPKAAPIVTPQGQTAYTADQIVIRVNELQAAAIQAEANGGLPTNTTRVIVQFCVSADKTLAATPSGWGATVAKAWNEAKANPALKPYLTNGYISAAVALVDGVLAAFQPGGGS
jgi:hypothetical protein